MLGEKVGEFVGKNTGRRIIATGAHGPKMEVSFEQTGKFFGIDVVDYGTYDAVVRGTHLEGTGQGMAMTRDGDVITWTATGLGKLTGKGLAVNWRGSIHYTTTSTKLAR